MAAVSGLADFGVAIADVVLGCLATHPGDIRIHRLQHRVLAGLGSGCLRGDCKVRQAGQLALDRSAVRFVLASDVHPVRLELPAWL